MQDFKKNIGAYLEREKAVLGQLSIQDIDQVINVLEDARKKAATIYICGNGGSAATASHFVNDFNTGISLEQEKKYNFISLHDNIPNMMAIANDLGYEYIFEIPLQGKIRPMDILFAISGSGNSKNILRAVKYAKEIGATIIGLTGYDGGQLYKLADYNIHVPIDDMQITEDIHMVLDHLMMSILSGIVG